MESHSCRMSVEKEGTLPVAKHLVCMQHLVGRLIVTLLVGFQMPAPVPNGSLISSRFPQYVYVAKQ